MLGNCSLVCVCVGGGIAHVLGSRPWAAVLASNCLPYLHFEPIVMPVHNSTINDNMDASGASHRCSSYMIMGRGAESIDSRFQHLELPDLHYRRCTYFQAQFLLLQALIGSCVLTVLGRVKWLPTAECFWKWISSQRFQWRQFVCSFHYRQSPQYQPSTSPLWDNSIQLGGDILSWLGIQYMAYRDFQFVFLWP